jgi:hypothetical protein
LLGAPVVKTKVVTQKDADPDGGTEEDEHGAEAKRTHGSEAEHGPGDRAEGDESEEGNGDRNEGGDGDGNPETEPEGDLGERVATLERTVGDLREELDRRERVLRLLAGSVDVAPVTARCPECETGELYRESGLSWAKLHCPDCGARWEL